MSEDHGETWHFAQTINCNEQYCVRHPGAGLAVLSAIVNVNR
jgi:hypothetical protein